MDTRRIGSMYEDIACRYLVGKGYEIFERNYQNKLGEIDIIAGSPEKILVYCEVKYRSSGEYGTPLEAVGYGKRRKICRAASLHFAMHHYSDDTICRFDVIGIYGDGNIEHIENAFDMCR